MILHIQERGGPNGNRKTSRGSSNPDANKEVNITPTDAIAPLPLGHQQAQRRPYGLNSAMNATKPPDWFSPQNSPTPTAIYM